MQPAWSGTLSFHDLKMPLKLYPLAKKRAGLHPIHNSCQTRLIRMHICPQHGLIANREKAFAYQPFNGQQIVLQPHELDRISLASKSEIAIRQFVPKSAFDPSDFKRSFFLSTSAHFREQFLLLRESLRQSGLYGITNICLKRSERPAVVWVKNRNIVLSTLLHEAEKNDFTADGIDTPTPPSFSANLMKYRAYIQARCCSLTRHQQRDHFFEKVIDLLGEKIVQIASANELSFVPETAHTESQEYCEA